MRSYNGLLEPALWPPRDIEKDSSEPLPVPYLTAPPEVVDIAVGRQLFVDDFLIHETDLSRSYHSARMHEASPVLTPQTELELNRGHCPMAAPFNDGAWFDPQDGLFKLWYHAGWFDGTALATSADGIHWERPTLDVVPGSNAVVAPRTGHRRDGGLVWLDHQADPRERFKMFQFYRWPGGSGGEVSTSPDGAHWSPPQPTSRLGDNSSFFFNPFRERFVFSIREGWPFRARAYHEHADFRAAASWEAGAQVRWVRSDRLDLPDPLVGDEPQLYDVNAVAYESILLGAFALFYGPQNPVCAKLGRPKTIDLQLAYSRDGFHWQRPERSAFIPCGRRPGSWDFGYIHAAGGVCLVVGDELWFYFAAFSGDSPALAPGETGDFEQDNAMYAGATTGLATLRRDGFASMDAGELEGTLVTRPLTFEGSTLFVNADCPRGELRVDVLDDGGEVIEPYKAADCRVISEDATRIRVAWKGTDSVARLAGQPVRFRFRLRRGRLYAFWVSASESGASGGYVAAGGPGFSGARDL